MPCFSPLHAWKGPEGIVFNSKAGYYDLPLQINCGQCVGCRLEKQRSWAIRAMHEAQMHPKSKEGDSGGSCFLTLTYDNEHLDENHSLNVKDWQDFAKRLRRHHGPFRFLHCGEYGEQNHRPHFHALIFGHDFKADSVPVPQASSSSPLWASESVQRIWGKGFHTIGACTPETARYVASYTLKKAMGKARAHAIERVDPTTGETWEVAPEYATQSRRPGLGTSWFHRYWKDVYPDNFVVFDGLKAKPPIFYDRLLEQHHPNMYEKMKHLRRKHIQDNAWDHTQQRLDVRATVTQAKLNRGEKPLA